MLTAEIEYDPELWVLLPPAAEILDDDARATWIRSTIDSRPIVEPWNEAPMRDRLEAVLDVQLAWRDTESGTALWFSPGGLPACAFLEISVEPREGRAAREAELLVTDAPSVIAAPTHRVVSERLGVGWAKARIVPLEEGDGATVSRLDTTMAEALFAFAPEGALISIVGRSADESAIGLMIPAIHDIIESIRFE